MEIKKVGVCGAGLMGSGIAQVVAQHGCTVLLYDVDQGIIDRALAQTVSRLQREVEKGRLSAGDAEATRARLSAVTSLEELSGVDLVIEAVVERIEVKRELFAALDRICPPHAILASNTSTLSPTEIGAATGRTDRTAGLHFFNPAPVMKLVEVIAGLETAPETVETLKRFAAAMGKTPVSVSDSPGGIVSRLQLLVRNEAAKMVAEGVATAEDIDTAMQLGSGWPMGPLALIDLVGVDLHVNNSDSLCRELGSDRYRPTPLLRKMVRAGHLGRRSGRGFYRYNSEGRR